LQAVYYRHPEAQKRGKVSGKLEGLHAQYAKNTFLKNKRINIRISERDFICSFTGNWLDISRLSGLRDKPVQLRLVI
jgi:hypothetical protein